jgi:hypothetical protein
MKLKIKHIIFAFSFLLLSTLFIGASLHIATNLFNGIILVIISLVFAFIFVKEFYDVLNGN